MFYAGIESPIRSVENQMLCHYANRSVISTAGGRPSDNT